MKESGRIIALDVGEARIGVAVSDSLGITAQPHGVIQTKDRDSLLKLIQELDVRLILIGIPKNLTGGMSPQAVKIKAWAETLQKTIPDYQIEFWDERYTSKEALRTLSLGTKKDRRKKGNVDVIAAVLMLQSYLDSLN